MNVPTNRIGPELALAALVALAACRKQPAPPTQPVHPQQPSNRIAVPETVRRNLGIEFVRVERRRIAQTLRVAGHFELLPAGRHELRTPLAGRVEVLVQPLQTVKAGDVVYRIDAPAWRQMQRELGELATQIRVHEARVAAMQALIAAHVVHEGILRDAGQVIEVRVKGLEETRASVGGQAKELAEARAQLAQVRVDLAEAEEKHAETDATLAELQANLAAGRDRARLALEAAAAVLSVPPHALDAPRSGADSQPRWRAIAVVEVKASADGVVDRLPVATGVWVETGDLVATISDLAKVRFRARALQSDLGRLMSGLPAAVVSAHAMSERVAGALALGVEADPTQRTLDLFLVPEVPAAWARPGVAAFLEIETKGNAEPQLAIPLAAALQDGLQRVLFRRDPSEPDVVIRKEADLGLDDGRWVEVKSGLRDGDEVVLAGAFELMLASSGTTAKGGHFHADGTFHEEHK